MKYRELSTEELTSIYNEEKEIYETHKRAGYKLDMSRGKPSPEQLDLSNGILKGFDEYISLSGFDCRNYGGLDGLPEMKKIFADLLKISPEEVIVGGNSSLTMMFDNLAVNMMHGVRDNIPWISQGDHQVKFICPSPGYDRHFAICEYFHIKMITVPMTPSGPDMDIVEDLVLNDPMIKGIWCVPKYSNPDGITYSRETVHRLARLRTAAHDFRMYWDNAYAIHQLYEDDDYLPNIIEECEKAGNPNMPLMFTSFSKISFSGAAVSALCSSKSNIDYIKKRLTIQTIGPDKLNQLRHIQFFKNAENVREHMKKHAAILKPKFEAVLDTLKAELEGTGAGEWNSPRGGYFISFYANTGCAKKIVRLCREAGVILTDAGATYPYGHDKYDSNIRIAPSFPSLEEMRACAKIFCNAVKLATAQNILENRAVSQKK